MSVSRRTLNYLRETLVDTHILREIRDLFRAEGFEPNTHSELVSGERRDLFESYISGIDLQSPDDARKLLNVIESAPEDLRSREATSLRDGLLRHLRRDGFETDEGGRLRPVGDDLVGVSLVDLDDDAAVRDHVDRMRHIADTDPELAIGQARELVESVAKYALEKLNKPCSPDTEIPELVKTVQQDLGLHAKSIAPSVKGEESIKKVLGSLTAIAVGMAELRNQYGTGHGKSRRISGLKARHARLTVNSASTYADFILGTLRDPEAPWRR